MYHLRIQRTLYETNNNAIAASEMTYIVSSGALNSTHSLTRTISGLLLSVVIARSSACINDERYNGPIRCFVRTARYVVVLRVII